jgi:hypothetical protein
MRLEVPLFPRAYDRRSPQIAWTTSRTCPSWGETPTQRMAPRRKRARQANNRVEEDVSELLRRFSNAHHPHSRETTMKVATRLSFEPPGRCYDRGGARYGRSGAGRSSGGTLSHASGFRTLGRLSVRISYLPRDVDDRDWPTDHLGLLSYDQNLDTPRRRSR